MALVVKNNLKQTGMTLLEVLIAMTLMVVISAIAFTSLNGLINAKHQTDIVAKQLRKQQLTSLQLHKDITAFINRSVKDELGNVKPALLGRYADFELSRGGHKTTLNNTESNLQRVHWFIQDNQLIRAHINTMDLGSFAQWQQRKYLDDVKRFSIKYINASGIESSQWPVANNLISLKSLILMIELKGDTRLTYEIGVTP